MKTNIGSPDRIVRVALAVIAAALVIANVLTGAASVILGIVAAILFLTAIVGFCPIYRLLGISTKRKPAA